MVDNHEEPKLVAVELQAAFLVANKNDNEVQREIRILAVEPAVFQARPRRLVQRNSDQAASAKTG